MRDSSFQTALAAKLNKEIENLGEQLALGHAKDFGDYKFVCGIARGLRMANEALIDLVQQMERDDDD